MKNRYILSLTVAGMVSLFPVSVAAVDYNAPVSEQSAKRIGGVDFKVGKGRFELEGSPFVIKAAELHYPRIPREYWDQRIKMCKALGMNTICLYVFWNAHETEPGKYDFDANNDLRKFIEMCDANGMKVILRPGPYVCAEWEMGGLPWWLLRDDDIELRHSDPRFLAAVERFEKRLATEIKGLTAPEGGPIIMIQVENEYGSYGDDKEYVKSIADMLGNLYPGVVLFQCDWASNFTVNGLPGLVWTMNFGTGADIDSQFAHLRELRPESPLMCSEFWSGWFDKWGANHETRPAEAMVAGIEEMLSKGISFSLYMTHGGTNWGHWAGANSPGYAPDVTSYDYDAPIDEQGAPTAKYMMLRGLMSRFNGGKPLPPVPEVPTVTAVERFQLSLATVADSLWDSPRMDVKPLSMEKYGQGYGMVRYVTRLPKDVEEGDRLLFGPRDYVQVFADGKHIGTLDRRVGDESLVLPALKKGAELQLMVEAMGRINFGTAIKDPKGMAGDVVLESGGRRMPLEGWSVSLMPDDFKAGKPLFDASRGGCVSADRKEDINGVSRYPRGLYKGYFDIKDDGDTYLDMSEWGKGQVWVNGHPLGRFWEIGPQQTLYLPGAWLKPRGNEVVVLDVIGPRGTGMRGLAEPLSDVLQSFGSDAVAEGGEAPDLSGMEPLLSGRLTPGNGWKSLKAGKGAKGNTLILEIGESHDGGEASVSEIYLTDRKGNRLSRETWRVTYTGSADMAHNRGADKMYDLQESTYWQSDGESPTVIAIDLGGRTEVWGLDLLPRAESGAPGQPSEIKVFIK